jgi:hypothetical protein
MKIIIFLSGFLLISSLSYALGSTDVRPRGGLVPQNYQSYVDINNCTAPIESSPYIIVLGNGGANMNLSCPADRPVMYGWRQEVGFGGFSAVQAGGGRSWITCCGVKHKWAEAVVG